MLDPLNQRLLEVQEEVSRLDRLERQIAQLEADVNAVSAHVEQLQKAYDREQRDVDRLEGLSLTALFYTILGSKETQLERERQEALAAELKLREEKQRLQEMTEELAALQQQAESLSGARERYSLLMEAKGDALVSAGGQTANKLRALNQQVQDLKWEAVQIREARAAAMDADAALGRVIQELSSAERWGAWDVLGGGYLVTAAKHSSIDSAQQAAHKAQRALDRLRRELQDVGGPARVADVSLDAFSRFADYFFDGLITDWVIQSRISESLSAVRSNRSAVADVSTALSARLKEVESALEKAEQERQKLIASFQ